MVQGRAPLAASGVDSIEDVESVFLNTLMAGLDGRPGERLGNNVNAEQKQLNQHSKLRFDLIDM